MFNQPNIALISIFCAIGASFCFSLSDFTIKILSVYYPLHQIILIRSVSAFIFTIFLFVPLEGGFTALKTKRPLAHLFRGLLLVFANLFFFLGLVSLPIAECSAIFYVAPLLITVFSSVILKEKVGFRRFSALVIGFIGVLIIVKPGQINFEWVSLLPLSAAICYAGLHIMTRQMGLSEKASTLSIYIQISFILVSMLMGIALGDGRYSGFENSSLEFLVRAWIWPINTHWLAIIGIGISSSIGGYLISQAYRLSEAGLIAPFEYTTLILSVIWGIVIWNEWLSLISLLGIMLIFLSGIYIAVREVEVGVKPSAKRASGRR